jgi:hypothetical protein
MSPKPKSARTSSALAVALSIVLAATAATVGADEPQKPKARRSAFNRPLNAFDAGAVERAKARAAKKLQQPECQRVLSDFKDAEGRPLQQNLETWGMSPAEYLERIPFRDGVLMPRCQKRSIEMVTSVGLPTVYLCPADGAVPNSRFAQVMAQNPSLAEAMIIHEMLHTLGLGENPPSTFEITARVRDRCR